MPNEFNSFLEAFSIVGTNFAENLRRVVPDPEMQKVVGIYGEGLGAAMSGTAEVLRSHYEKLPLTQQTELDRMIGASGGIALLSGANRAMTTDVLGTMESLSAIPGIIEIAKKIITNFLDLPGGPGKLLKKIDLILDGLGKLFGFPKTGGGDLGPEPKVDAPPPPGVRPTNDEWQRLLEQVAAHDRWVAAGGTPTDPNAAAAKAWLEAHKD